MNKPAALPFFGDAYLADTTHLTTEEHGAYFLLMLAAWRQPDCALPDDDRKLARIAGVSQQKWRSIKATVMDFWTLEKGRFHQARLSKEHAWVREKSKASSKSAKARWQKQPPEKKENGGKRTHSGRNAPPPPPSNPNGLQPDGVSDQVWSDFIQHRKRKKADVTPTAMQRIVSQAKEANWPIEEALVEMIARGWTGFNAEWVDKREAPRQSPQEPADWLAYCESRAKRARELGRANDAEEWDFKAAEARRKAIPALRIINGER